MPFRLANCASSGGQSRRWATFEISGRRVVSRNIEFSSLKNRSMALTTDGLDGPRFDTISLKHPCITSSKLNLRVGYLKSKLIRPLVHQPRQQQGTPLPKRPLVCPAVAGDLAGGHEIDQDFDQEVQVGLQVGSGVQKQGLQCQQKECLFGKAVEDRLVLVMPRGAG